MIEFDEYKVKLNNIRPKLDALAGKPLITFHDGFAYFARAFGLEIAAAMEIEAGSEPSARELEEIIRLMMS